MEVMSASASTKLIRSFREREVDDPSDDDDEAVSRSIRAAFNLPFPPHILASTNVGKDG
jgi:hypothetical protein